VSYVLLACRVTIVVVFVVAVAGKVRGRAAYADFRRSITEWRVLPRRASAAAAAATVAGEVGVVLLLALPGMATAGFAAGALLLAAFTTGVVLALRRGRTATCRCFGASTTRLGGAHVARNAILIGVCVAGAVSALVADGAPIHWPGAILALVSAGVGALFVVRFDDLVALGR
jgi:hypothetical protein